MHSPCAYWSPSRSEAWWHWVVLRTVLGHSLHGYLLVGYLLVISVTFFAPPEIVGLAYDSGGVTTNIVTVPLITALGIGLATSLRARSALMHGFGLVALAVMVPMILVQLYGIVVYQLMEPSTTQATLATLAHAQTPAAGALLKIASDLLGMVGDILPIVLVVLFFQYAVIRKPLAHLPRISVGFVLVIVGLYAFVLGLKLGLFPIGRSMAEQLVQLEIWLFIYLFAFAIGFATTLAEPALIAIGEKAEEAGKGRVRATHIRLLVAVGVALGLTIGVHRLISGDSIHLYILCGYSLVILMTWLAPSYIVPLAFDLGGVTTSEVTVPLVTALGIGLASSIEGRNVLIDGFGLIAFASLFPILTMLLYAIVIEYGYRKGEV